MNKGADVVDLWLKTQKEFMGSWLEGTRKLQDVLSDFISSGEQAAGGKGFDFRDIYSSWMNPSANYFAGQAKAEDFKVVEDTFQKLFSDSNVYMKLFNIWKPIFSKMQEKTLRPDSYWDMMDPANYMKILEEVLGFCSPAAMAESYKQAAKIFNIGVDSAKEFSGPWSEAFRKNWQTMPGFLDGHLSDSILKNFHSMFGAYDATFGKALNMPAVWKDREKVELCLKSFDDLSSYLEKSIEYQYRMYSTGLKAMGRVMEAIVGRTNGEGKIGGFSEFLDIWVQENEKTFHEMFNTEEFAKFQGEYLDSALNVRRHYFKLMELHLYDFPVAVRSEMDDLYKQVYELKRQVRSLQKTVKDLQPKEATA
ncbi:MAG: hypothetical protein HZA16_14060 [Nitrospirae bacterium]|nr:hypothetical protein [Nitrospirota bacterium]